MGRVSLAGITQSQIGTAESTTGLVPPGRGRSLRSVRSHPRLELGRECGDMDRGWSGEDLAERHGHVSRVGFGVGAHGRGSQRGKASDVDLNNAVRHPNSIGRVGVRPHCRCAGGNGWQRVEIGRQPDLAPVALVINDGRISNGTGHDCGAHYNQACVSPGGTRRREAFVQSPDIAGLPGFVQTRGNLERLLE